MHGKYNGYGLGGEAPDIAALKRKFVVPDFEDTFEYREGTDFNRDNRRFVETLEAQNLAMQGMRAQGGPSQQQSPLKGLYRQIPK